jgi:hypothetical protein
MDAQPTGLGSYWASAFLVPIAPVLCPMHPPVRDMSRAN